MEKLSGNRELTIDRDIWLRGENDSYLLRQSDGRQCCLGIYLESCGLSPHWMIGKQEATLLDVELPEQAEWLIREGKHFNSEVAGELMSTNDDRNLSEENREEEIIRLFSTVCITVRFIN